MWRRLFQADVLQRARATVTVTVVPNGNPVTTPCGAATTTVASGVTGVALLAGVYNPTFAVDNDINTGSSLVIPVGLLGASVYHQVGFTGLSNVGDTLKGENYHARSIAFGRGVN